MKMINLSGWAPRKYEWNVVPIPITNPLIANHNKLFYNFHTYNAGGVTWFYYKLSLYLYEDN